MSEDEKSAIRKQHEIAAKKISERKEAERGGLKQPEKIKEKNITTKKDKKK